MRTDSRAIAPWCRFERLAMIGHDERTQSFAILIGRSAAAPGNTTDSRTMGTRRIGMGDHRVSNRAHDSAGGPGPAHSRSQPMPTIRRWGLLQPMSDE